ncbi:MAG: PAS domain S-box protein [Methylococcales bacterium]
MIDAINNSLHPLGQQMPDLDRRRLPSGQLSAQNERRKALHDRRRAPRNNTLPMRAYTPESELTLMPPSEQVLIDRFDLEQLQQALIQSQLELNCSQNRYWNLYEFSPISYITLTAQGLIANLNPSCAKLLGAQREQLYDTPFARFIRERDVDRWNRLVLNLLQGDIRQGIELNLMRVGFETLEVRLDCQRLATTDAPASLLVAISEISKAKLVDEQLCLAASAFDIEEGIMVMNTQMIILQVNKAFTRLTGFSSEEAIGRTPHLFHTGLQNPDFYQNMWITLEQTGYWQGEIWNQRKDTKIFPEWLTISAIKNAQGEILYYVASFMDISFRKQSENNGLDTRQQLEQQLQQKNAELHQIEAELNNISTALKVLIQHQETEYSDVREVLEQGIKQEIVPFLSQLKKGNQDLKQLKLLQILEANLENLSATYGRHHSIARIFQELTPKEIQIASMIRQGLSTKHIAATLSTSAETINVHRKNIRKKLGLDNKAINLRNHLNSFE